MTSLDTFFILMTAFVAHIVTVTTFPLDEEDDGYESDAAQCDDEEDRDELWDEWESSVGKRKISEDEGVAKKV